MKRGSFAHFLSTQTTVNPIMRDRLIAANPKSLAVLCRWVRERYPETWKRYSIIGDGTGKDQAERLWAQYLNWKEGFPK